MPNFLFIWFSLPTIILFFLLCIQQRNSWRWTGSSLPYLNTHYSPLIVCGFSTPWETYSDLVPSPFTEMERNSANVGEIDLTPISPAFFLAACSSMPAATLSILIRMLFEPWICGLIRNQWKGMRTRHNSSYLVLKSLCRTLPFCMNEDF